MRAALLAIPLGFVSLVQAATLTFTNEATFLATLATHTTQDFEGFAPGTIITNQLAGITMVSTNGDNGSIHAQVGSIATLPFPMSPSTHSGDHFLSSELASPIFATAGLNFDLNAGYTGFGYWVTDGAPLGGPVINLFNGATLVGTVTFGPQTVPDSFVGVISTLAFNRVTVDSANSGDSWGLDSLTIGNVTAGVPEPSTLGLVGGTLILAAFRKLRKRS